MLVNVPIESLVDRYSAHWNNWFPVVFDSSNIDYVTIYPEKEYSTTVVSGEFLNVVSTNRFKADQLSLICKLFEEGKVTEDTTFFFHDLWFPGIEMLFYIRDGLGINFKITGMLHAGTYDKHDFLAKKGMARWAEPIERSWLSEVDALFLATTFHAQLLMETGRIASMDNVFITGFPLWVPLLPDEEYATKENIIVFPHRLAKEKNPYIFDRIATSLNLPGWRFIKSKDVCNTKSEYYDLLAKSKIAVSCADQETWGIAQQEALFYGCIPIVPDFLSYKELYSKDFKYKKEFNVPYTDADVHELVTKLQDVVHNYEQYKVSASLKHDVEQLHTSCTHALPMMISVLESKGFIRESTKC